MLKKQNPKQHIKGKGKKRTKTHNKTEQNINSAVYICSSFGIKHVGVDKHEDMFNSL